MIFIHLIPERNDLGIGGCWNMGVHHPKCGKFAVQLDSDDVYKDENTLSIMVPSGSCQLFFEKFFGSLSANGDFLRLSDPAPSLRRFPTACSVFMQTKTPHKTIARLVRGPPSSFYLTQQTLCQIKLSILFRKD